MIAITGHTSGIGRAIADWFISRDQTVIGYSRSTGHDLAAPGSLDRIVQTEADIFVNNAYHRMAQVDLLYAFYDRWKNDPSKTILTISSNSGDGIKSYRHPYAVYKAALDKAVQQLQNTSAACRILNLRPGYVDTPRISHIDAPKLTPEQVADIAGWMLSQSGYIQTLTVVP